MDARKERGIVIAAMYKLNRSAEGWLVPSQTGTERIYRVDPTKQTCTCPDHLEAGFKCKHLHAVEIVIQRELFADGTVVETKSITFTEKKIVQTGLAEVQRSPANGKAPVPRSPARPLPQAAGAEAADGQPRPQTARSIDCVFAMAYKVYCGLSSRRVSTDFGEAHEMGFLSRRIPGVKVTAFLEDDYFTPILKSLIGHSASPLRAVETAFAIDSSGFSTSKSERWFDEKYGVTRQRGVWVKAHIAAGPKRTS